MPRAPGGAPGFPGVGGGSDDDDSGGGGGGGVFQRLFDSLAQLALATSQAPGDQAAAEAGG